MNATMVASGSKAVPPVVSSIKDIPLAKIRESKTNPRRFFDEAKLAELADFVPGNKSGKVHVQGLFVLPAVGGKGPGQTVELRQRTEWNNHSVVVQEHPHRNQSLRFFEINPSHKTFSHKNSGANKTPAHPTLLQSRPGSRSSSVFGKRTTCVSLLMQRSTSICKLTWPFAYPCRADPQHKLPVWRDIVRDLPSGRKTEPEVKAEPCRHCKKHCPN